MTTQPPIDSDIDSLRRAYNARMNHSISETKKLLSVLEGIHNDKMPIDHMAEARGIVAKLGQTVNEASAYHSAYTTMIKDERFIPMTRPHINKARKRWKGAT